MWTDYLELLARDSLAVEYEAPVLAARAAGESDEVLEQLEQGKLLALRVREKLLDQRRREDELTALYETADDLARLSDLDSVLLAIVHRARQLLRTDIAYLTMNDADHGDTYMRVTDGSTSARFQQVRLGMGEGLGGSVAQSAMPYSTSSYFGDERFNHTLAIDGAVAEEGLVAILGVPLQLGTRVIGVLYAANRSERPFSRSETALLGSLAAHAAAAIDKARLLDETRIALEELRKVNVLLELRGQAVERASDAHDRMTEVVLRGGGVEDVALALVGVLGGALLVLDEDGRDLAQVGTPARPEAETLWKTIATSQATGRAASCQDGDSTWWIAAVTAGQQQFGSLLLHTEESLDEADQRILERAGVVTALLLLGLRSRAEAENRVRGELLDELLRSATGDAEGLAERARRLGVDLELPHSLFVVALEGSARSRAGSAVEHVAARSGGLAGTFDGRLVLLLPELDPAGAARRLVSELSAAVSHPVTVGSSGPVSGVSGLALAHREAVRCVTALRTLGRGGEGAALEELGFVGLVLGESPDVPEFVAATLGPLLEYDAQRSTELVTTLAAYFDNGGNLARTREALHVHVNTVAQRLERIGKLIGEDWSTPDRQLELQVALRLHRVSARG